MACKTCSSSITSLTRQQCGECSWHFCSKCMDLALPRPSSIPALCKRCTQLLSGNFTRADLHLCSISDLKLFLTRRQVDTSSCRDKLDLVELVMQTGEPRTEDVDHSRHVQQLVEKSRCEKLKNTPGTQPGSNQSEACTEEIRRQHSTANTTMPPNPPSYKSVMNQRKQASSSTFNPTENDPQNSSFNSGENEVDEDDEMDREYTVDADESLTSGSRAEGFPGQFTSAQPRRSHATETRARYEPYPHQTWETREGKPATPAPSSYSTLPPQPVTLSSIDSRAQIKGLSVRQLKELLETSHVNYKGCLEKGELVERVTRLWAEDLKRCG